MRQCVCVSYIQYLLLITLKMLIYCVTWWNVLSIYLYKLRRWKLCKICPNIPIYRHYSSDRCCRSYAPYHKHMLTIKVHTTLKTVIFLFKKLIECKSGSKKSHIEPIREIIFCSQFISWKNNFRLPHGKQTQLGQFNCPKGISEPHKVNSMLQWKCKRSQHW